MQSMKHILWPAVLLMATTTVGFAQNKSYNNPPKHDAKHEKYDGCDRKHEDRDKGDRDRDRDRRNKSDHDRDRYRDQDHKDYRDNSQRVTATSNNS